MFSRLSGRRPRPPCVQDVRNFHALLPLPDPEPEDFEAPDVIVTDVITGRTWMVSRFGLAIGNCQCGCAAYAEDITESWEAFLAAEDARADEDETLVAFTYGGGELPLTLARRTSRSSTRSLVCRRRCPRTLSRRA